MDKQYMMPPHAPYMPYGTGYPYHTMPMPCMPQTPGCQVPAMPYPYYMPGYHMPMMPGWQNPHIPHPEIPRSIPPVPDPQLPRRPETPRSEY
ncbi:hypothetical protein IC620_09420 [Hazenella sp. IB182357]|uniref:Uncharacterized protein n=1 Tax=Polycladospora coralii TaxID=2771432 RepID=A0A926NFW2_9BACL|nr:hypothetical protein [Polycladospora coralii]MBD1372573.1 hypothetical protein [Polycladospora coralii]MBS7531303.1 hypothetical protein [Polycladospora coralii]